MRIGVVLTAVRMQGADALMRPGLRLSHGLLSLWETR